MLRLAEAEQAPARTVDDGAGRDHLRVKPRPPRQETVEEPAMPIRPVHHRGDAETPSVRHDILFRCWPWGRHSLCRKTDAVTNAPGGLPRRAWSACPRTARHGSARLGSARLGMDELGGPTLAGKDPVVRRVIAVEKNVARARACEPLYTAARRVGLKFGMRSPSVPCFATFPVSDQLSGVFYCGRPSRDQSKKQRHGVNRRLARPGRPSVADR